MNDTVLVNVTVDLEDHYRSVDFHQTAVAPLLVDEPPPLGGGTANAWLAQRRAK